MTNEIVHPSFSFEKISDGRFKPPPEMLVGFAGVFAGATAPAPPRGIPKTLDVGLGVFLRTAKRDGVSRDEREDATPTCSAEPWRGKIKARAEIMERRMVSICRVEYLDQRCLTVRNRKL